MILTIILVLLGLVHFYWAIGGKYGLDIALPTDAQGKRLLNPSTFLTYVVGFILLGFAYVAFVLYTNEASLWETRAGWTLALLFFLRAVGDFNIVGLFKKVQSTKFSKYDTLLYVPLCFMVSFLFIIELV